MPYSLLSNSPVSGQIAWSDVRLVYDGVDYVIANGTTNKRFVYWLKSAPSAFQVADELPALGPDDTVVFLNKNGIAINVLNATALEGDLVVPGTITSNAIATDAIDATHIKSDAILARHILAGEITADKITISSLRALSANMGDLTSGTITVDQAGFIRGGASAYGSGTGFWMGYHGDKYKWRVGTPGSSGAEWDGSSFNVRGPDGSITISSGVVDWEKISGANKPQSGATRNVFSGDWAVGVSYVPGDIVMRDGNGWSCILGHTASAGNQPPTSGGTSNTWWAPHTVKGSDGAPGLSALTVVIPNSTHTLSASSAGVVSSYVGSGTTIQVFEGTTALSAVSSITGNGQFTIGAPTQSPASTITVGARSYAGTTATVAQHSAMVAGTDGVVITYPITVRRSDGTNVSLSAMQTITKAKSGASGSAAKAAFLTATSQVFQVAKSGSPSPSSVTLTASGQNVSGSPTFSVVSGTATLGGSTGNTRTLAYADMTTDAVTIKITWDGQEDYVTVVKVREGNDGLKGDAGDAIDIVFQRSASQPSTPAASAGAPSGWYSDTNSVPAGSDPMWSCVGTKASGATNYTWQTPIKIEGSDGSSGTNGMSIAELTIFRRGTTPPSTPTGGTYNFSTKVLTPPSGWSVAIPTGTDPVYASRSVVSSTNPSATSVAPGTWSAPVVSFQNGANGTNAIVAILSNESHIVPTDSSGNNGTYTGAVTTMTIYNGVSDDSANWTVTAATSNVTGSLSGKTYTVTGLSADTGYVDLTAKRSGYADIVKRFVLAKSKAGQDGSGGSGGFSITPSRPPTFTATDGALDSGQSNIVFTATESTGATYVWTFTRQGGSGTTPTASTGTTYTVTPANFGTSRSATVTCTINGTYSDTCTIVLLSNSTAEPGATTGGSLSPRFALWDVAGQTLTTVTDGKVGSSVLRLGTGAGYPTQRNYIPIDPTKKYRVRFWARPSADCNGALHFSLRQAINETGTWGPTNGGRAPYKPSSQTKAQHDTTYGAGAWGEYSYIWDATDWQADVKFFRPEFLNNYGGTAGYWEIQDGIVVEEVTAVEEAKLAANLALNAIAAMGADSILTPIEKKQLLRQFDAISAEVNALNNQAGSFGITTSRTTFVNRYNELVAYVTPIFADMATASTVVFNDLRNAFANYYSARELMLNDTAFASASYAQWAGVSGAGKPQDNATVGATIGTNLGGTFTQATWNTYISNVKIDKANIGSIELVGAAAFNVKTSTSTSTSRIEMNGQVIKVFEGSTLRVQIGNLSA